MKKRKPFKRVLSIILCAVMLVGIVPMNSLGLNLTAQAATALSGKCGDNLTWSFNETSGTLTISGTGSMFDYKSDNRPWESYEDSIKKVVIEKGVTSIGNFAFDDCEKLTSITIGNSVTSIGFGAFYHCDKLTEVTIPNSVKNIGYGAFSYCLSLTSITVESNNNAYSSDNYGVLFNKNKTILIQYPIGNKRTSYTIPNSVTSIGYGYDAFFYCDNLTSITIPNSVTSIGDSTFAWCSSLKSITIPNSVTSIGEEAFSGCSGLTSVTIPNSVTSIGDSTFAWCSSLKSITIPNSVTSIGDYAFFGCSSLTSITIPDSVTSIGYNAFDSCDKLADVYYSGTKAEWDKISIDNFNECLTNATIHYNSTGASSENEKSIAVFSTEKSFCIETGKSMWLAFGLMDNKNGTLDDEWKKMAVTVSNPSIISLSEYSKTEYGYSLELTGKKEGSTNITVTDTKSGTSTIITINVFDKYSKTYSYDINNMPSFYPSNKWENDIKTNIYDLNGLYVNNYSCRKSNGKYYVSFDVYNSCYYNGAVDIYDADGIWIGSEYIEKYSDITSIKETATQTFYLIKNLFDGEVLSYKSSSFSKKTHIDNIEIPDGGYFTISNNIAESPGTFFANAFEILYGATSDLIGFATSKDIDNTAFDKLYKEATKSFAQNIIDARNESLPVNVKKKLMEVALNSMTSEINKITKKFVKANANDYVTVGTEMFSEMVNLAENILSSYDISWKHLYQLATGVAESAFIKFSGPAGIALKAYFSITNSTSKLLMATQMAKSSDNPYANIYSKIKEGYINSYGVIVNTNGNIDTEAVLQVFRVSNDDSVNVVLNNNNPLEASELYNICFVKNDKLVQPNGKVKVYIPIPDGMKGNSCVVYRQENDTVWSILDATVEGNYLVFETNHFSLYAIVGQTSKLKIKSLPNKTEYLLNEILNTSGLTLELNGETINEGFYCSPTVLSESGNQTITVNYLGQTTTFNITVSENPKVQILPPTKTSINYGDSIVLHVDEAIVPAGGYVEWSANNGNFTYSVSDDGKTCTVTSKSSGKTTFTATVYDKDGNEVSSDTQEMTSKAGFFQKFAAFFKKLFGLLVTYPRSL